ncbi:IS607 family element RNA-guided endonuclease TnpB [Acrocarpospora sp. B8E8]|uniref:IS607 family element RNA-guided endonuclease TnpB n=1 Tax=Acrocarpospora sp. B8E8 TaxID=3153572 RepID=UPI00325DBA1B
MKTTRAYRFALDPAPAQEEALCSHAGAARFAFNWGLALVKANLDQREAEKSYGVPAELLTPSVPWNLYGLRRAWNQVKGQVAPWWAECSKEAYSTGLANLTAALANWDASRKGIRKGKKMGFPKFKKRHKARLAVRFTTGVIRLEPDRRHVTLPRLGTIRTHESTRKLARHLERGTARILAATVAEESGRWHVAFTVELDRAERDHAERVPAQADAVVGVDLGVKSLAVLSTGEVIANPKHHQAALRELRRANRRLARRNGPRTPAGGRRQPSRRWRKAKSDLRRVHAKIAARRRDGLHKLTTTLARTYGTVVAEDLNVAGMVGNRRLARAICDAGMGEVRRQLSYKTGWNGGRLLVCSRWFPSSKTCSGCGAVKAKLPLRVRTYACEACGLVIDRDHNAALNLAALAADLDVAQSCGETGNARGADVRPGMARRSVVKREPRRRGTPDRKVTAA